MHETVRGERRLAAVIKADIVGYSRLMAEDEEGTVRMVRELADLIEGRAREHGGRIVDFTGDNFHAEFPATVGAARFAISLQEDAGLAGGAAAGRPWSGWPSSSPGTLPLSSLLLPMHAGTLLFLQPERFADRASVRRFVAGEPFAAWIAVVQQVVIGGIGVPAASGPMPGSMLERAQIAAHALLGDLELLARVAAEQTGGPIAFSAAESALKPGERIAQWAALARVAASLAAEGAAPERGQPIFDALDEALARESGS